MAEIARPLVQETAQEAGKRSRLAAYFGQPTFKLKIAKFLEAPTSDFIEPFHGN
jgi:hypothetical protein